MIVCLARKSHHQVFVSSQQLKVVVPKFPGTERKSKADEQKASNPTRLRNSLLFPGPQHPTYCSSASIFFHRFFFYFPDFNFSLAKVPLTENFYICSLKISPTPLQPVQTPIESPWHLSRHIRLYSDITFLSSGASEVASSRNDSWSSRCKVSHFSQFARWRCSSFFAYERKKDGEYKHEYQTNTINTPLLKLFCVHSAP